MIDIGASSLVGDRRLDPIGSAVYLSDPHVTPTATAQDRGHGDLRRAEPGHRVEELFLGGQPFEELPQRPELDAGVRAAVPVQ